MSASQEKKRRREQREEGTEKRQVAQKSSLQKQKRNRTLTTIIVSLVVVFFVAVIIINSSLFYKYLPAVEIGDESYTAAEFNYFYFSGYYNFAKTYSDYVDAGYFFDTSKPLKDQAYDDTSSWADYFQTSALSTMEQVTMLCAEGEAAGFAISDAYQSSLDSAISGMQSDAASNGYTIDAYCEGAYGKGCDFDTVKAMMAKYYYAYSYAESVNESFAYTADELDAYYQEKKDTFDYIDYRYYYVSGSADEEAGIDSETAMQSAKTVAQAIADNASDDDTFADLVYQYAGEADKASYEDPDATLYHTQASSLSATYSEWLLDAGRSYGDTEIFESTSGYYAVMYIGRDDNHYNTRQVRHILIKAVDADSDGAYSEEELATAYDKAEEIYREWRDGDATEDSFAELAGTYSEDTGSNANGGLYENIYEGQTVEEFDAFCFDESRKYGDTAVVYGESSSYAGYHIMFWVGEGGLYSGYLAENTKRGEDYEAWQTAQLENYAAVTKFAIRFGR